MVTSGGELLWFIATVLVALFTVTMAYYAGISVAALFWAVAMLILMALRPDGD